MVGTDGHQASILARSTTVGLQRHGSEAGDLCQLLGKVLHMHMQSACSMMITVIVQLVDSMPPDMHKLPAWG